MWLRELCACGLFCLQRSTTEVAMASERERSVGIARYRKGGMAHIQLFIIIQLEPKKHLVSPSSSYLGQITLFVLMHIPGSSLKNTITQVLVWPDSNNRFKRGN